MCCICEHIDTILESVSKEQMHQTTLGLSHNMNRFKLRYSPDKIDQMIVQAISLLDDLDKELNKYAMCARVVQLALPRAWQDLHRQHRVRQDRARDEDPRQGRRDLF